MKLTRCPICESDQLREVSGKLSFQSHAGEVKIPKVTRTKCDTCGEEFFDREANKILDQYRGRSISNKRSKAGKLSV